jgi:hypothetical protein
MIVEKTEEFFFARHQSLEKALHLAPRFVALLAMPAQRRQAGHGNYKNAREFK